jgi:predicted secreted protein
MTTSAKSAFRTAIIRDTYIVAELSNISGFKSARSVQEATNHDSANTYREYIAGLKDGGQLTLSGNFIPGDTNGQAYVITDFEAGTVRAWLIAFPNAVGASFSFSGIVQDYQISGPLDAPLGFSATVKLSGKPTLVTTGSTGLTTSFFTIVDNDDNAITPSPTAAQATYEYTATALTGATSINITPTATAGTIHVNGTAVTTTEESGDITLGDAGTTIMVTIRVTETNKAPKIYRIWVTRAAS